MYRYHFSISSDKSVLTRTGNKESATDVRSVQANNTAIAQSNVQNNLMHSDISGSGMLRENVGL